MLGALHEAESGVLPTPEMPQTEYAGCSIGRYDVINLVGKGSSGDVYAGRDGVALLAAGARDLSADREHPSSSADHTLFLGAILYLE